MVIKLLRHFSYRYLYRRQICYKKNSREQAGSYHILVTFSSHLKKKESSMLTIAKIKLCLETHEKHHKTIFIDISLYKITNFFGSTLCA